MGSTQRAAEFLTSVLSKRGPQELPYTEDTKWTIRQHLLDLTQEFLTLAVKAQDYTHTDGRMAHLLMAEGTLPMYYMGVKYNIPVAIWLPDRYPRQPPILYVVPTPDMIIKPRHKFVDASGTVNSPYIRNWTFPRSNLVDMCHDTSIQFGNEPPLFSKPPGWVAPETSLPSPPTTQQSPSTSPYHQRPGPPPHHEFAASNPMIQQPNGYAGAGPLQQGSPARQQAGSQQQQQQHQQYEPVQQFDSARPSPGAQPPDASPRPPGVDLEDVFRKTAEAALNKRLRGSVAAANAAAAARIDALFDQSAQLANLTSDLDTRVASAQRERGALEAAVLEIAGKTVELDRWLAATESRMPEGEVDPAQAIVPADSLSRQALDAQAEDMAIEDALYALDKALQAGMLEAEAYLRQVRLLCRRQFFARALGTKIAERQHDPARPSLAAPRVGSFGQDSFAARRSTGGGGAAREHHPAGVQMPQGDSWANTGILANPLAAHR